VTRRDERIVELSDRLARARGRLSSTARMLRELCAEHDPVPAARVIELLSWLDE
jgi:hypothetical protein